MPEKHSHSRAKSALGGGEKSKSKSKSKSKPKPKKDSHPKVPEATKKYIDTAVRKAIKRMHINKTANGQFLVDHEFESVPGQDPFEAEQHAISPEDLSRHVSEGLGIAAAPVQEPMAPPAASLPQLPSDVAGPLAPAPPAGPAMPMPGPIGV